jgi:hypothetical protein
MIGFLLFFELKKALGSKSHGLLVCFTAKKPWAPREEAHGFFVTVLF